MAQRLAALVAFSGDPGLFLAFTWWLTTVWNSRPRRSNSLLLASTDTRHTGGAHTYM